MRLKRIAIVSLAFANIAFLPAFSNDYQEFGALDLTCGTGNTSYNFPLIESDTTLIERFEHRDIRSRLMPLSSKFRNYKKYLDWYTHDQYEEAKKLENSSWNQIVLTRINHEKRIAEGERERKRLVEQLGEDVVAQFEFINHDERIFLGDFDALGGVLLQDPVASYKVSACT